MSIVDFAHQILDMQEEINMLRHRNAVLEQRIGNYQEHVQASNQGYEKLWGSVLSAAIDPKNTQRLNNIFNKGE